MIKNLYEKSMRKNLLKFGLIFSFSVLLPTASFAAFVGPCPGGTFNNGTGCVPASGLSYILYNIQQILNSIIPVLVSLGVVYFVFGVVQYVIADGEEAKKKGKDRMIYGIIGFAVIISFWGLVTILANTLGLDNTAPKIDVAVGTSSSCSGITNSSKLQDVLCYATSIINNSIIPLIFAGATVMFVWGVINFFILNAEQQEQRAKGKQFMIWGIVALAVMLSVWGLVGILGNTIGVKSSVLPRVCPPDQKQCP